MKVWHDDADRRQRVGAELENVSQVEMRCRCGGDH